MPVYANSEKTYEALIDAAGELAADRGFDNVSTRAIATRAGANISSIHYHFGGKEGLCEAVVRRIIDDLDVGSYRTMLESFEPNLDTHLGQARAISAITSKRVRAFFDKDKPWWFPKVIYQIMQYDSPLYRLTDELFIKPVNAVIYDLLERIRPGMPLEDKFLYDAMTISLCSFHSNYRFPALENLGVEEYTDEYVNKLEQLAIRTMQNALDLPVTTGETS